MDDETLEFVLRAIGDPTRRRIIDLLREGPRTSGEIAAAFPDVTRVAVMKHIRVLVEAHLITYRREGRHRWNYLNPVPILQVAERWIRPLERRFATSLLRLGDALNAPPSTTENPNMPGQPMTPVSINVAIHHVYPQSPDEVFDAIANRTEQWWGAPYIFNADAKGIVLEPRVGGRFFERWDDAGDRGALWGFVKRFDPPRMLEIQGALGMPGVAHGVIQFELTPHDGGGTRLDLVHRAFGDIPPDRQEGYHNGWIDLLAVRLAALLANGARHGLGHPAPDAAAVEAQREARNA